MYLYRAYGLLIHSQLRLPAFSVATGPEAIGTPDVKVVVRPITPEEIKGRVDYGKVVYGRMDGVMRFIVEDGQSIVLDPFEGTDEGTLVTLIGGMLISTILRQRGLLVLHAAGVANEEGAVGFVGYSGWGKSTTAGFFNRAGYRVLNDDVLALDVSGEEVIALPGFPQVKLLPDAGKELVEAYEELPHVHFDSNKRAHLASGFRHDAVPLRGLYILERGAAESTQIVPLTAQQAIVEVVAHTRMNQMVISPEYQAKHLAQCAALVAKVPVRLLRRVRSIERLSEVVAAVEEDVLRGVPTP